MRYWPLVLALGCGSSPPSIEQSAGEATAAASAIDTLGVGGCAPIRYKTLETPPEKPSSPAPEPPPSAAPSYRLRPRAMRGARPGPGAQNPANELERILERLEPRLVSCVVDAGIDRSRVSSLLRLRLASSGSIQLVHVGGTGTRDADRCIRDLVRASVRRLPSPTRAQQSITYLLEFVRTDRTRPRPPRPSESERPAVELLSASDAPASQLTLGRAIAGRRQQLGECVARGAPAAPGTARARVRIADGAVGDATVFAETESIGDCAAAVLAGAVVAAVTGEFECALSYGSAEATRPVVTIEVGAERVLVDGEAIVDAAVLVAQKPPTGLLYRRLESARFAEPGRQSPAPARLRIGASADPAALLRAIESIGAADLEVAVIDVGEDTGWRQVASRPRLPMPRLSGHAGRAATATALFGPSGLWIGVAAGLETTELTAPTDAAALDSRVERLRRLPGLEHRRDAVVGIGPDTSTAELASVLEALVGNGFDMIEIAGAEQTKARLAR